MSLCTVPGLRNFWLIRWRGATCDWCQSGTCLLHSTLFFNNVLISASLYFAFPLKQWETLLSFSTHTQTTVLLFCCLTKQIFQVVQGKPDRKNEHRKWWTFNLGSVERLEVQPLLIFIVLDFLFPQRWIFFFQISAILASDSTPINALDVISDLIITAKIFMAVLSLTSKK